ncbi:unnamed protein product [Toxocara canis]|uniref:Transposase n=1 Tax=Toxocara canis TaxID=6265 RepID=A0A183UC33_TOXCA|nr:unnamed protein product [Toxocara canis]
MDPGKRALDNETKHIRKLASEGNIERNSARIIRSDMIIENMSVDDRTQAAGSPDQSHLATPNKAVYEQLRMHFAFLSIECAKLRGGRCKPKPHP